MVFMTGLPSAIGDPANDLPDQDIADAVENELHSDAIVNSNRIDVNVVEGVAELTGTVSNLLARERSTRIAEMVKGVRTVSNRLDVAPGIVRSDDQIREAVENALFSDPATDAYELDVAVIDGVATLSGTVDSWSEKALSEDVAKSVRGVRELRNEIDIELASNRADYEILPEVRERLKWDVLVNDGLIDVAVNDGRVELHGVVGSAAERRRARRDAWVAGVRSVDDSLEVLWWSQKSDLRADKYVPRDDHDVAQAIHVASIYDPRLSSFNIRTEVEDGWVTLRGKVDNLKAKRAAEQLARHTVGVLGVTNRLKVRTEGTPADGAIADRVESALLANPTTDAYEIMVSVDDGRVRLSGMVDDPYQKSAAESVAAGVRGVSQVDNFLVTPVEYPIRELPWAWPDVWRAPPPPDEVVREQIQEEFFWSPFVDGEDIDVEVKDSVATLRGTVQSWYEYRAAEQNAIDGGARSVVNRLTLETSSF